MPVSQNIHSSTPSTKRPSIYIYPITPYTFQKGSNDYILRVKEMLGGEFKVVNSATKLGVLDILLKLPKCNIVYLNWVEDIVDRRMGYLQIPLLFSILVMAKLLGTKVIWFVHNDVSHFRRNWKAKRLIRRMMAWFSDKVFSHSGEFSMAKKLPQLRVFPHPVEEHYFIPANDKPEYDVLVWGSVSRYKGVHELAKYNYESEKLKDVKILVAGRFVSPGFYEEVQQYQKDNIRIINRVLEEAELEEYFSKSSYILFCYSSASVLSSAALCKSLAYGKTIIGPDLGAFRELGKEGLIYTYKNFDEMAALIARLKSGNMHVDQEKIKDYINRTSWEGFRDFLVQHLDGRELRATGVTPAPVYSSAG